MKMFKQKEINVAMQDLDKDNTPLVQVPLQTPPGRKAYNQGIKLFHQAEAEGFQNKATLRQAYQYLSQAQRQDPHFLECLHALVIFNLVIDNRKQARTQLAKALQLNPEYPATLALQDKINALETLSPEQERQGHWLAFDQLQPPKQNESLDFYLASVDQFVKDEVAYFMQSIVSPELTFDADLLANQEEIYQQILALEDKVQAKLEPISKRVSIERYAHLLHPITLIKERFRQTLENHAYFQILMDGIQGALGQAFELEEQIQNTPEDPDQDPKINQALDQLCDLCDALADELDTLSESQNIQPLETAYNELIIQVSQIQDWLDGI